MSIKTVNASPEKKEAISKTEEKKTLVNKNKQTQAPQFQVYNVKLLCADGTEILTATVIVLVTENGATASAINYPHSDCPESIAE